MAPKDTNDRKDDADNEPMVDTSQAAVKKMIAEARERGYITYEQLNQVLPCRVREFPEHWHNCIRRLKNLTMITTQWLV